MNERFALWQRHYLWQAIFRLVGLEFPEVYTIVDKRDIRAPLDFIDLELYSLVFEDEF